MANSKAVMDFIRASRPTFRNNHDKIVFALHASFFASGFVLTSTGRPAFADDALSSSSTIEVGIEGWNEFDEYAFVYAKGSKKFLVKCLAISDKLLVDALADGGNEPAHIEIDVGKYVNENTEGDYASQFKNLDELVTDLQNKILFKLDEGLKPVVSSSTQASGSETTEEPLYYGGNPRGGPLRPAIDPSGVLLPPIIGGGYSDLYPGPGAGMYPGRFGGGDGSMFVGPGDPRFFGDQPGFMGPPQPGVLPPGSRYDPIGPPGIPGFEPGRFARQPPRRPGMHPDLEHFPGGGPGGSDFI